MKFGNWGVNEKGIEWLGNEGYYLIEKSQLNEAGFGERKGMFDFLVHLTEKTWLNSESIEDVNKAYIFAFAHYEIEMLPELSMVKTLNEQARLMSIRGY